MANQIIDKALAHLGNFVTKTAWAQGSVSRVWYRKVGDVVTVTYGDSVNAAISANTWTNIDTLPTGSRPSRTVYASMSCDNQVSTTGAVRIQSDGKVDILTKTALTANNSFVAFGVSYIV